ncbi:MAG: hypothetical protein M3365_03240 [Gemmatimonadota bacterium]|nr:hypothetical protein [Gemmatimonadota bacterium]
MALVVVAETLVLPPLDDADAFDVHADRRGPGYDAGISLGEVLIQPATQIPAMPTLRRR